MIYRKTLSYKDIMVLFYVPWFGHCKQLFPIHEDLSKKYNKIKDKIIFTKIDATENEIKGVEINETPTLLFFILEKKIKHLLNKKEIEL